MNAIEILKQQHREVEQMFKEYESNKDGDPNAKLEIFNDIADALAGHAAIEEQCFYPSVLKKETEEVLREAVEEHLSMKRVLADMLDMKVDDPQFDAKMRLLMEEVERHVEEEEGEMFSKVRKAFDDKELEELGIEMENLLADLMAKGEPRMQIPKETETAAPLS